MHKACPASRHNYQVAKSGTTRHCATLLQHQPHEKPLSDSTGSRFPRVSLNFLAAIPALYVSSGAKNNQSMVFKVIMLCYFPKLLHLYSTLRKKHQKYLFYHPEHILIPKKWRSHKMVQSRLQNRFP